MKRQKFFNVTMVLPHSHWLGRNVIESWLQYFFGSDLKGEALAKQIGKVDIYLVLNPKGTDRSDNWWEREYLVKQILPSK